jgi:NAD(P)-dependent dehydrogenase (short-subunit alcohol dehydrogenase family)
MENNKVWFITGANRGLGAEIARSVLNAGHKVVATARNPAEVEKALGQHSNLLAVKLDVTNNEDATAAVAVAKAKFGRIDVLVNNAGYGQLGWFENNSEAQIRNQFEVNVFGTMHLTREVLPLMRAQRSGHIFTISSVAGFYAVAGSSTYSASKFAIEGWMEGLVQEVKPLGISATLIEPGFFKTDFLDSSSVSYGEYIIDDYTNDVAKFIEFHEHMNHKQVGDPTKLGHVLMTLAQADEPPVRFSAGSDSLAKLREKTLSMQAEAEQWKELSSSTDGAA